MDRKAFIFACTLVSLCVLVPATSKADQKSDIEAKIAQSNTAIANLEKEIAGYQKQLDALSSQADSLTATLKSLDLTQKKLAADIQVTQGKIAAKTWEIQSLGVQIDQKQENIEDDKRIIRQSLVLINQQKDETVPHFLLAQTSLAQALDAVVSLNTLQSSVVDKIKDIQQIKTSLEGNKAASEKAKADLVALNAQLSDQRQVVINTQAEKNSLLAETKQSQSDYQAMLRQKKALKDSFEQEVLNYESQLKRIVDLSKLPQSGSAVLRWPLDSVLITQYFGNTPFATANPQIYNGAGHTGIDLNASIGTPVRAALSGVVVGSGNTDIVSTCYSFGKWIMIQHPNGLSTLYAHLSLQVAQNGQTVSTGDIIGYSGNTGYTTGPHLHFGVYASSGVDITAFKNSRNCPNVVIPFASLNAYLNPLSFLPPVP